MPNQQLQWKGLLVWRFSADESALGAAISQRCPDVCGCLSAFCFHVCFSIQFVNFCCTCSRPVPMPMLRRPPRGFVVVALKSRTRKTQHNYCTLQHLLTLQWKRKFTWSEHDPTLLAWVSSQGNKEVQEHDKSKKRSNRCKTKTEPMHDAFRHYHTRVLAVTQFGGNIL